MQNPGRLGGAVSPAAPVLSYLELLAFGGVPPGVWVPRECSEVQRVKTKNAWVGTCYSYWRASDWE